MTVLLALGWLSCGGAPDVGIDQRLGSSLTLDAAFRDEHGERTTLREASAGKPIVLALVYYRCPLLCNEVLRGLRDALVGMDARAPLPFSIVTVSFDPQEGPDLAAARKARTIKGSGRSGENAGWRFLTGDAEVLERLCAEAGFRILYDPATRQYAHATALVVLTPQGRISRYLMGVTYSSRDLRLAVREASDGKIGGLADGLLLLCLQYDPSTGKYSLAVWRLLRSASLATVLGLVVLLVLLNRRKRAPVALSISQPGEA